MWAGGFFGHLQNQVSDEGIGSGRVRGDGLATKLRANKAAHLRGPVNVRGRAARPDCEHKQRERAV